MWLVSMLPELLVMQLLGITILIYVDLKEGSTVEDLWKTIKSAWFFYIPWIGLILFFVGALCIYLIIPIKNVIKEKFNNIKNNRIK